MEDYVSVVIPLYNKQTTVARALRSVLAQSYTNYEIIVVDNGSTDNSVDEVHTLDDERIRVVTEMERGVSVARNRGIDEARYDLIAFLDADDEWDSDFLATVMMLHGKYPECAVYATNYRRCNSEGIYQATKLNKIANEADFVMLNYFDVAAHSDPPFCSISIMVRKAALYAVGRFPIGIQQGEDLLTWARLAVEYKTAYCQQAHCTFHTGEKTKMDMPRRMPKEKDEVGKALETLHSTHADKGIAQYISHWHKMRASMFLRVDGYEKECRAEIDKAQRWNNNKKLTIYKLMTYVPYSLRIKILSKL